MRADRKAFGMVALALVLAGCGGSEEPRLMNLRSTGDGPDEFAIVPVKPLQMPGDLAALPAPTPGSSNLSDPTPEADAIIALGGKPGAGALDSALVGYAARNGLDPQIRSALAGEDLQYRRDNEGRLLDKVFDVNVYNRAYEPMSLDQYAELERWRRAGLPTPSAPPKPVN